MKQLKNIYSHIIHAHTHPHQSTTKLTATCVTSRGSATPMKMGGGGDGDQAAAKPGFSSEDNPYHKPKTHRIWPTIFLKMGGLSPALSKMGGTRLPVPPPLWRSPWSHHLSNCISQINNRPTGFHTDRVKLMQCG